MSEPRVFILAHQQARMRAAQCIAEAPEGWRVTVKPPSRTTDQNAKLWATLTDLSRQVDWHGQKLSKEEWKDVLTAAQKRQKVVPGIDGGFVVLGSSTSRMSKADMIELIELATAFGAQHGVIFGDEVAA